LRKLARVDAGKVQLTPELERALAKHFLEELRPFRDTDKLGALLLQLSPSFSPRANKLGELESLFESLEGSTVGVELRNRNWVTGEQCKETLKFFKHRKIPLVSVDAPSEKHFMIMPSEDYVTGDLAYLRCHGRNAEGYIKGRSEAKRPLWEYKTHHVQELLGGIATDNQLSRETIKHIKAFLSGVFRHAVAAGLREGAGQHERIALGVDPREAGVIPLDVCGRLPLQALDLADARAGAQQQLHDDRVLLIDELR